VKLQRLIENLLTFSAWQTHTAALELSEFELKPMVFSVLSQHRLALSNKKIKLQLTIAAINVHADEGKLPSDRHEEPKFRHYLDRIMPRFLMRD